MDTNDEYENELSHQYITGDCKIPDNIDTLPKLSLPKHPFVAPRRIDNRDQCIPTGDQGQLPHCAAWTMRGYMGAIMWKRNDYPPTDINPSEIYSHAKKIDGDPNGNGTTLTAVLDYALKNKIFDSNKCKIEVIWNVSNARDCVKYAIHKYGCILSAFNITTEWYTCNKQKSSITGNGSYRRNAGGHAVLAVGYDENGIYIQNSWGEQWSQWGFGLITWEEFDRQFLYAACLSNALDGLKLNT